MITDDQLSQIMPTLPQAKRQLYLPALNQAMRTYGVNTMQRTAAFVAQLAHESGEFRFMEEIWGPTPAQLRYEPPSDLATRLGNTQSGDGKLFKGRGPIQITGRFNYQKYGGLLGIDLIANPPLAATPDVAFSTAGLFWKTNGLNELADQDLFTQITKRINGGTNGLDDRLKYYGRAKAVLAAGFDPGPDDAPPVPTTRGAAPRKAAPPEALARGYEAILELAGPLDVPAAKKAPAKKAATKQATAKKPAIKKAIGGPAIAKTASTRKASTSKASTSKAIPKKDLPTKLAPKAARKKA